MKRLTINQVGANSTYLLCNKIELNYGPSEEESLILLDYNLIESITKNKRVTTIYNIIDSLNERLDYYWIALRAMSNSCGDNLSLIITIYNKDIFDKIIKYSYVELRDTNKIQPLQEIIDMYNTYSNDNTPLVFLICGKDINDNKAIYYSKKQVQLLNDLKIGIRGDGFEIGGTTI